MQRTIQWVLILLVPAMIVTGCSKFLDVNENPNSPSAVPVEQLLPNALVSSVNMEASGSLHQLGSVWAGHWSKATDGPAMASLFLLEETYAVESMAADRDGRTFWEDTYTILTNYRNIEILAAADGDLAYAGISKIMQGLHFMRLVDLYNNIPFEDALRGTDMATPRFETGADVYAKSIDLVTAGISDLKNAAPFSKKPVADDVVFKGDLAKWIRFGNTIKLRALLRQSETGNNAYVQTQLQVIAAEGSGYLQATEDVLVNPGYIAGTTGLQNPLWESNYRNAAGNATTSFFTLRPTAFVVEQYRERNDPRLASIYAPAAATGEYTGVPLGSEDPVFVMANTSAFLGPLDNGNIPAGIFKSATQSSVLLSAAETLFLQAEAAKRGWISADAGGLYNQAITASFRYLGTAGVSGYLLQESVDLAQAANPLQRILEQKWLALNSISGIEAWNDYRRTGWPVIPQSLQSPNPDPGFRPLRLTYRQSEISGNGKEVAAQGEIDPFSSLVFWDRP